MNSDSERKDNQEPPPMTFDLVVQRLKGAKSDVSEIVYGEVLRQLEFGYSIRDKIERKAQIALSVAGLAITLSTGLAVKFAASVGHDTTWLPGWLPPSVLVGCLLLLVITGVVAALFALRGLKIAADNQQSDYRDVFSEHALKGKTAWYTWMSTHVYTVAEAQQKNNDKRASSVRNSLRAFVVFLSLVVLQGIALSFALMHSWQMSDNKGDSPKTKQAETTAPQEPQPTKGGRGVQGNYGGGKPK